MSTFLAKITALLASETYGRTKKEDVEKKKI
jgi:hypothetical protein